jgi:thiol-disulfide isomerase/thioredoxin
MKVLLSLVLVPLLTGCGHAQTITPVKVEQLVKTYQAAKGVTVINFWSTWCKPCIEEIPHFISLADSLKSKGVQLLLVSQDTKTIYQNGALKKFVAKKGWKPKTYWLNETDADHYCPAVDSTWSGVIPVTLIINPVKNYRQFYESALKKEELRAAVEKAL